MFDFERANLPAPEKSNARAPNKYKLRSSIAHSPCSPNLKISLLCAIKIAIKQLKAYTDAVMRVLNQTIIAIGASTSPTITP